MATTKRKRRRRRWLVMASAVPVVAIGVLVVEVALARRGAMLVRPPLALDGTVGQGDAPLEVVWLGDSTAAGVGAPDAQAALPRQVARGLGPSADLTVLATSGARISDVVERQVPSVAQGDPDVVFVSAGANDVTHLTSRRDFDARYRSMVSALPAGSEVVLLGVPDMGAIPRLAQPLRALAGLRGRQLDGVVRDVASDIGAAYVDIAGETGPSMRADPDRFFADDDFHPSAAGYQLWAEAVLEVVGNSSGRGS